MYQPVCCFYHRCWWIWRQEKFATCEGTAILIPRSHSKASYSLRFALVDVQCSYRVFRAWIHLLMHTRTHTRTHTHTCTRTHAHSHTHFITLHSPQFVFLIEPLMPLCSRRHSPPSLPSTVSVETTTLSILTQTLRS